MSFDEQFLDELVGALREVQVEAVIVGNVGAILHGAPIMTDDVESGGGERAREETVTEIERAIWAGDVDKLSEIAGCGC